MTEILTTAMALRGPARGRLAPRSAAVGPTAGAAGGGHDRRWATAWGQARQASAAAPRPVAASAAAGPYPASPFMAQHIAQEVWGLPAADAVCAACVGYRAALDRRADDGIEIRLLALTA